MFVTTLNRSRACPVDVGLRTGKVCAGRRSPTWRRVRDLDTSREGERRTTHEFDGGTALAPLLVDAVRSWHLRMWLLGVGFAIGWSRTGGTERGLS